MSERFERFKKMAKDEFGLTVVESDNKKEFEKIWNKWNSTEVEYIDFDGALKKVPTLNPILNNSVCFIIEGEEDNEENN